ncbi:MAG: ArsR family transcriptional regulator [Promethearchaeota archaeon]
MSQTDIKLLKLLLEGPQLQKDLPKKLKVKRPTIKYHVDRLEEEGLINKKLIAEAGPIKVVELAINKLALPQIRKKLNLHINKRTLISGFTFDPRIQDIDTLKLPDITRYLLTSEGYEVDKLVCFTTKIAMQERKKENLPMIDRYIPYPFKIYQDPSFSQIVEQELAQEILNADVIIDITPLTKIYTITMLNIAHHYKLPVVYVARENSTSKLIKF